MSLALQFHSGTRPLLEVLSAMKLSTEQTAIIECTQQSLHIFSQDSDMTMQATASLDASLFRSFTLTGVDKLRFAVLLQSIVDTLNVFSACPASVSFAYPSSPTSSSALVSVDEGGFVSECIVHAHISDEHHSVVDFLRHRRVVDMSLDSQALRSAICEIEWLEGPIKVMFSQDEGVTLESVGPAGRCAVNIHGDAVSSMQCPSQICSMYNSKHFIHLRSGLQSSSTCRIRVNEQGMMTVQLLLQPSGKSMIEFFLFPVVED